MTTNEPDDDRTKIADGMRRMAGALHRIADAAEDGSDTGVETIAKSLVILQKVKNDLAGAVADGGEATMPDGFPEVGTALHGALAKRGITEGDNRFDRYTDRARSVLQHARAEAQRLNHPYIGAEHILLGMLLEKQGVAAQVLRNFKVEPTQVRDEISKIVSDGPVAPGSFQGALPFTPRAKNVLVITAAESRRLNHGYVGTEHLLMGILIERESVAAQVLQTLLKDSGDDPLGLISAEILELLGAGKISPPDPKVVNNSIEAWLEVIQICAVYLGPNTRLPVHCEHDKMWICLDQEKVSDEHKVRLAKLGWDADDEGLGGFWSYQSA